MQFKGQNLVNTASAIFVWCPMVNYFCFNTFGDVYYDLFNSYTYQHIYTEMCNFSWPYLTIIRSSMWIGGILLNVYLAVVLDPKGCGRQ